MALSARELMDATKIWAQSHSVTITPGSEQQLEQLFQKAESEITKRTSQGTFLAATSSQVDVSLDKLLEEMLKKSPDKVFHEYTPNLALADLCPGFYPFC